MHRTLTASLSRFVSSSATAAFVVLLITTSLLVRLPAQSQMPNENCSEPNVNGGLLISDRSADFADAGVGSTSVTTYGTAIRKVPMPDIEDGLSGLSTLYRQPLRFDVSYSAWGSPGVLVGGSFPVPNLDSANLDDAKMVQPRPGTMPGLYLYQENSSGDFYHYGGPTESGASPQSTAEYKTSDDGGTVHVHYNRLSGAQLWHYNPGAGSQGGEYVEIKHVDGTIARFDFVNPYNSGYSAAGKIWHLKKVTDPYDNVADYFYDTLHRLYKIEFPSGLTQRFDYNPTAGGWSSWTWTNTLSGLQVRYEQTSNGTTTALTDRNWGIVFSGASGTSGGTHFALRLHRIYAAPRNVQKEQATAEQPYVAGNVAGQVVHEFAYVADLGGGSNTGLLTETNRVHTGTPFHATISTSTDLPDRPLLETRFDITSKKVNRQNNLQTTLDLDFSYTTANRTQDILAGDVLQATVVTDGVGNTRRFEYDTGKGKIYSTVITAVGGAIGKPRAAANFAANLSEPEQIEIYRIFDGSCDCQKPVTVKTKATRASATTERVVHFTYDQITRLITKRSVPNPATGTGQLSHVDYTFTYVRAKTSGQNWGAWLPATEVTPDGTWQYIHDDWLDRADATEHGRIPGKTTRQIASVRIQTTLTGSPVTNSTVSEVVYRNLSNSPGGLTQTGNINGQPRRIVDGDGVETTLEYTDEGWLEVEWEHTGQTKRLYAHDVAGNVTSITDRAAAIDDVHKLVWTFPSQSGFGLVYEAATTSGTPDRELEYYYDRYGHLAIRRHNNLGSDGNAPSKHGVAGTPRAWVESQWHYQHHQLWETYVDRQPLDEAAGSDQFLQTIYSYRDNGQLEEVEGPSGAVTKYQFDGYGTLFTQVIDGPGTSGSVTRPRRLINEFLELTTLYDKVSATDVIETVLTRNGAGVVTNVVEPETDDPFTSFPGATGGATHQFEIDQLGRVIEARSYGGGTQFTEREIRYDQLSRKIWQRDQVMGYGSGNRHTAWRYQSGKSTWLDTVETTGVDPTTYFYGTTGFLEQVMDGFGAAGSGNQVDYDYFGGTPFTSKVTRADKDPLAGTGERITSTEYDVDAFGNVLKIRSVGTPNLDHVYAYNSFGRVDRYTDPASRLQKFLPDGLGRIVEHVRVGDSSDYIRNRSEFVDFGATEGDGRTKVRRFDHLEHPTITHYDFAGRPFIVQNPGGDVAPTSSNKHMRLCLYAEYDLASRLAAVYDGDDGKTVYWRDGPGRLIMRELAAFDPSVISTWNSRDIIERDEIGRIREVNMLGGGPGIGHVIPMADEQFDIDSLGRTHQESYLFASATNNVIEIDSTYSSGNPYRSGLDYVDNLTSGSAPLSMDYTHDDIGRLSVMDWTGTGSSTQLASYGWAGRLRRTRDVRYSTGVTPAGATEFDYDEHDRLTGITHEIDDGTNPPTIESQFTYEYDLASNLTKEWYDKVDGSKGDRFAYDAYHRLTSAAMGASTAIMNGSMPTGHVSGLHSFLTYGLDGANNREDTSVDTGSGSTTVNYDLQDGTHAQGPSNRYEQVGPTGAVTTLIYDDRGNLTYDGQFYYVYDYLSRLQEVYELADSDESSESSTALAGPTTQLGQEPKTRYAVSGPAVLRAARAEMHRGIQNFQARVANEHSDPQFRERLKASVPGGAVRIRGASLGGGGGGMPRSLFADADLTLVAIYGYDAFNRRILTVLIDELKTNFHTWDGWRQTAEFEQAGAAPYNAKPVKQFVWGARLDELISYRRDHAGTWENYFILHGGQDTAAKLVDSSGALVETYEYSPYGKSSIYVGASTTPQSVSSVGLPFLWKGIRLDAETGLMQMRNRYYTTVLGRFLTIDHIGVWGDPMNLGNGYGYVGERQLVFGDPFGLQGEGGSSGKVYRTGGYVIVPPPLPSPPPSPPPPLPEPDPSTETAQARTDPVLVIATTPAATQVASECAKKWIGRGILASCPMLIFLMVPSSTRYDGPNGWHSYSDAPIEEVEPEPGAGGKRGGGSGGDDCKKASKWHLMKAGLDKRGCEHDLKEEYVGKRNISKHDICACADGTIKLAGTGGCGKPGPKIDTYRTWNPPCK